MRVRKVRKGVGACCRLRRKAVRLLMLACGFAFAFMAAWILPGAAASAGAFEPGGAGVPSAIGEIGCHGEDDLEDQFLTGLQDAYEDAFRTSEKFNLKVPSPNPQLMSQVHFDAIVHGHFYNRGHSNADLIRYANDVLGEDYRPTDEEYKAFRKKAGTPYKLSPQVAYDLKQYAAAEGVRYFIFCNINHIEVWLKNIIFSDNKYDRGKTIAVEMEYYLVDAETGFVFDGFSREAKTANMINAIIVKGGKNMPSNVLFQRVMEKQVKDVVKDMGNKGLDKLKKVSGGV